MPCYNERDRAPSTLDGIRVFINQYPGIVKEVICVDDGSTDSTVEELMKFSNKLPLRVERLERNRGKWAAIHHGIMCARTDAVLLLDADGAANIFELEKLSLSKIFKNREAVFGSRFMEGSNVEGKSLLRKVISHSYRAYVRFWFCYASGRKKRSIDDMQCPFKLIFKSHLNRKMIVHEEKDLINPKRYDIDLWNVEKWSGDIELACCLQNTIVNHPVDFTHVRGSKLPVTATFMMAKETAIVARRFRRLNKLEVKCVEKGERFEYITSDNIV
jgi:glycosyltransferase involved in cell wall biosynthesis